MTDKKTTKPTETVDEKSKWKALRDHWQAELEKFVKDANRNIAFIEGKINTYDELLKEAEEKNKE